MKRLVPRVLLALAAIVVAAVAIASVRLDSATSDESAHIAAGIIKLQFGWLEFYPGQPPLIDTLIAAPIMLAGDRFPRVWSDEWTVGHQYLYQAGYDPHRLLFMARLPIVALFLALCFTVWWFVRRQTGSEWWALAAFALTGFCPTLLAHGRLATVDLGATFLTFAAAAAFLRVLDTPTPMRGISFGALTALALLAKVSSVVLGPWFVVVLVLKRLRERVAWRALAKPLLAAIAVAVAVFVGYYALLASNEFLATQGTNRFAVGYVSYSHHFDEIRQWVGGGYNQVQFLLGEFSDKGWRHYFFVALFLKTPLAAQMLFLVALAMTFRRRAPFALQACMLFVAMFLAIATTSRINLGIRYVLPIFPFAFAAIAIAFADLKADRRLVVGVFGALLAWHVGSSLAAYPSYLSYFNELVPARKADQYLIDSNLDWGQDLRRLAIWRREHGVQTINVDYFGGGDVEHELGPGATRWSVFSSNDALPRGWFALSRHFYRLSFHPRSKRRYDAVLAQAKARYVTTIGGSIDVYEVP